MNYRKPSQKKLEKSFDTAHANRLFEVDLFWKRAIFFWGFVASTFVGFAAMRGIDTSIAIMLGCFGFLSSFAWTLANRGSKYWQEYWEQKVEDVERDVVGELFIDHTPKKEKAWFGARKFSVSKLAIAISDYLVFVWFCLTISEINTLFKFVQIEKKLSVSIFLFVSFAYLILVFVKTRSRVEVEHSMRETSKDKRSPTAKEETTTESLKQIASFPGKNEVDKVTGVIERAKVSVEHKVPHS